MGYSPWDLKDLDKTERLTLSLSYFLKKVVQRGDTK